VSKRKKQKEEREAASREKGWRPCLKCGKNIFTDKSHRICSKCRGRGGGGSIRRAKVRLDTMSQMKVSEIMKLDEEDIEIDDAV